MNALTLKALKTSIAHWKRMARDGIRGADKPGCKECALCVEFLQTDCKECPVKLHTGLGGCEGTPYMAAHDAWFFFEDNVKFRYHARREVKFLERLLPKSKTKKKKERA